jgi:hypothetical protein
MSALRLGKFGGLEISALPTTWIGTVILWGALSTIGYALLRMPLAEALVGGLLGTILHWIGEFWHQNGHAIVARRLGYPMTGIRTWWVLSSCLYPADEPELAPQLHIRRALGGPAASAIMSIISGVVAFRLVSAGGLAFYLAVFFFLDNLLVLTLGAFLPLGFNDGSSLLHWWGKLKEEKPSTTK